MLVGRGDERAQLDGMIARARGGGSTALVVHGEPGIGKTRLLEYAAEAAAGFKVLRSRPLEAESELAFAGLSDLLRPVLSLLDGLPGPQAAALSGALSLGPPTPGDRFAIAAATLSLLAAAAGECPVLAIVDDVHWLDRPSREALLFAGRRLGNEGVLLLLGTRDGKWIPAAGLRSLELSGLPAADAAALIEQTGTPTAAAARNLIVTETRGNPLAILEAVAALTDAELLGKAPVTRPLAVGASLGRAFAGQLDVRYSACRSSSEFGNQLPRVAFECPPSGTYDGASAWRSTSTCLELAPLALVAHQSKFTAVAAVSSPTSRRTIDGIAASTSTVSSVCSAAMISAGEAARRGW